MARPAVSMLSAAAVSWFEPDWPAPASVRALFTTRHGGLSESPWDTLNLGAHVGDRPEHVAQNRALLQSEVRERGGGELVFLNQVHGCDVLDVDACAGSLPVQGQAADGSITGRPGRALVMMVADCLPVLITDRSGRRVGAFHAGWRGLAGGQGRGILESAVEAFARACPTSPALPASDLLVWLGPCIGPSAFEVGADVLKAFGVDPDEAHPRFAARPPHAGEAAPRWLADLAGLARDRLAALRLVDDHIGGGRWCTVSAPSRFFSFRRDAGRTGRQAACIWLERRS